MRGNERESNRSARAVVSLCVRVVCVCMCADDRGDLLVHMQRLSLHRLQLLVNHLLDLRLYVWCECKSAWVDTSERSEACSSLGHRDHLLGTKIKSMNSRSSPWSPCK